MCDIEALSEVLTVASEVFGRNVHADVELAPALEERLDRSAELTRKLADSAAAENFTWKR